MLFSPCVGQDSRDHLGVASGVSDIISSGDLKRKASLSSSRPISMWDCENVINDGSNNNNNLRSISPNSNKNSNMGSRNSLKIMASRRHSSRRGSQASIYEYESQDLTKSNELLANCDTIDRDPMRMSQVDFEKSDSVVINQESSPHNNMSSIDHGGSTIDNTSTTDELKLQTEDISIEKFRDRATAMEILKNSKDILKSIDMNDPKSKDIFLQYMKAVIIT